jgi:preprotein translocase subunit SecD
VRVIKTRIERGNIVATVAARGEAVIVDLAAAEQEQIWRAKDLIARTGKLEVKVIDSGTPLMQQVYTFAKQDPAASDLRVSADTDQWAAPDGSRHTDYFLIGAERKDLDAYLKDLQRKDAAFTIPLDRRVGYERVESEGTKPYWRTYLLVHSVRLSNRDISNARPYLEPQTGRPGVIIDLGDQGTARFAKLTASIVGKKIAIVLDDRVVSAPIIMSAIDRGRITLAADDPKQLAIVLLSGALPTAMREESVVELDGDKLIYMDENGNKVTAPR